MSIKADFYWESLVYAAAAGFGRAEFEEEEARKGTREPNADQLRQQRKLRQVNKISPPTMEKERCTASRTRYRYFDLFTKLIDSVNP